MMTETADEKPTIDEPMFVIYNKDERGFWSNTDGWTGLEPADHFTEGESQRYNLPTGGVWMSETEAQHALWPGCGNVVKTDKSCLMMTAVVTVSFAVGLAFDPNERIPGEQRLREILLENFADHPGLEDPDTAKGLKYEIIDAHEE